MTTSGKKFKVADHDFTKCRKIPSVMLFCDIPAKVLLQSIEHVLYVCGSRLSYIQITPSDPPSAATVLDRVFVRVLL